MGLGKPYIADEKTRELLVYVAHKLKDLDSYGSVMLNKALYLIDSMSYLRLEKPISNFKYVRQEKGATPAPYQFLPLREGMIKSGELQLVTNDFWGLSQKKYIALREPNIEVFDKMELVLIDWLLEKLTGHNATSASELTHRLISWQVSNNMDELPHYTFLLSSREPDETDIEWAKSEIEKLTNIKN